MMDVQRYQNKSPPKNSKWHLWITSGEWMHIIDLICIYGEIWHAADSFVEIVKFYSAQNVLQRMTDCNDQMRGKQPQCVLNSHCTFSYNRPVVHIYCKNKPFRLGLRLKTYSFLRQFHGFSCSDICSHQRT